eukprot:TRINITY_DN5581_c0_g1_i1.p1 TRINITY_DN5581_c0_g1~~TRINITY_DN5581_c0_g1_i1.p1  ORF type:complete len:480 (+),score=151.07 TRINITY_DN5581_c0_g1_i1:204-1643(+)
MFRQAGRTLVSARSRACYRQHNASLVALSRIINGKSMVAQNSQAKVNLCAFSTSVKLAEPTTDGHRRSWAPATAAEMRKMATQSLLHELTQKQQQTYESVVDWFLQNMPATYFRQTSQEARLEHLQAISAMMEPSFFVRAKNFKADSDAPVAATRDIVLKLQRASASGREVTVIQPGSAVAGTRERRHNLLAVLESLPPADGKLSQVKVFNSLDRTLAINVFAYKRNRDRDAATPADAAHILEYAAAVQCGETSDADSEYALSPSPLYEPEALKQYLARCETDYAKASHPRRFLLQRELYERVSGTEGVAVHVEHYEGAEQAALPSAQMPDETAAAPMSQSDFIASADALKAVFVKDVEVDEAQALLCAMVDAACATLRTNLYMPHRYALGMRLDPAVLLTQRERADPTKEVPFGAFFVYGRRFRGFHVRFRVRAVTLTLAVSCPNPNPTSDICVRFGSWGTRSAQIADWIRSLYWPFA